MKVRTMEITTLTFGAVCLGCEAHMEFTTPLDRERWIEEHPAECTWTVTS